MHTKIEYEALDELMFVCLENQRIRAHTQNESA